MALVVGIVTAFSFGFRLSAQQHFVDESAYISQTYFLALLAQPNHPYWLEYPAYDLPPLPKYMIGLSLRVGGERIPSHQAMKRWYDNTSSRFASDAGLWWARLPSVLIGGIGCAAICVLGTLATDRKAAGLIAAGLLAANPLYRMHARRAMSDVYAEALLLVCLAVGLATWRAALAGRMKRGTWIGATLLMGVSAGLAVLSKLNGGLSLMVLYAWGLLGLGLTEFPLRRRLAFHHAALAASVIAFITFAALNPFLWCRPTQPLPASFARVANQHIFGRTIEVIRHRINVSRNGQSRFPADALLTLTDKIKALGVQGFGRFGAFGPASTDSTKRYDLTQDYGAPLWGAWVTLGAGWTAWKGWTQRKQGEPPAAIALLVQCVVSVVTVTLFLPLAWDRYFLSIQPGAILLASGVAGAALPRRRAMSEPVASSKGSSAVPSPV